MKDYVNREYVRTIQTEGEAKEKAYRLFIIQVTGLKEGTRVHLVANPELMRQPLVVGNEGTIMAITPHAAMVWVMFDGMPEGEWHLCDPMDFVRA